jgi:PKD domain
LSCQITLSSVEAVIPPGSPHPTAITVTGTVMGCAGNQVTVSLNFPGVAPLTVSVNPTSGAFAATLPLPANVVVRCGQTTEVHIKCTQDATCDSTFNRPLNCPQCPSISLTLNQLGPCSCGTQTATFKVALSNMPAGGGVLQWDYGDGISTQAFFVSGNSLSSAQNPPHIFVAPLSGQQNYIVNLNIISPTGCPGATLYVTLGPCPPGCPNVTLAVPTVQGCAPTAVAAFSVSHVSWPAGCKSVSPTSYAWTLRVGGSTYQLTTNTASTDTTAAWTNMATGNAGPVPFPPNVVSNCSVSVTAQFPTGTQLPPACDPTDTRPFTVNPCLPCPSGTDITAAVTGGSGTCADRMGKSETFDFTAIVTANPSSISGFGWNFGDPASGSGNTATTSGPTASHTYQSPGQYTVTADATVPQGCPSVRFSTSINVPACSTSGNGSTGMSLGCWILLILALVVLVAGCIVGIVAACTANPYAGIAAGILFVVGLILLALWLFLCAHADCKIFNWFRWIVIWILYAAPIVALIVGLVGKNWPCALFALIILWAYWGTVLAILDTVGPKIGCSLLPPPWP